MSRDQVERLGYRLHFDIAMAASRSLAFDFKGAKEWLASAETTIKQIEAINADRCSKDTANS